MLFAGEVFPVKHLRSLCELWPHPRYFNLYGPTETNVCTYYEVALPVPPDRTKPYPIGYTCSHLRSRVVDETGDDVARGTEGELCIAGPGVMIGDRAAQGISEPRTVGMVTHYADVEPRRAQVDSLDGPAVVEFGSP